jgi:hypothetical protein
MTTYPAERIAQLESTGNPCFVELAADFRRYGALTKQQIGLLAQPQPTQLPLEAPVSSALRGFLSKAFMAARSRNERHIPKLVMEQLVFRAANPLRASALNRDAVFVTRRGPDEIYLGKIIGDRFSPSTACTADELAQIEEIMCDPFKHAVRFGHAEGKCSVCSRPLSDPESIAAGIGPVCRAKFGW